MVITLSPELEAALNEAASHRGVAPEMLVFNALRERFLGAATVLQPQDEWERRLLGAARDWGISLPDSAVSRNVVISRAYHTSSAGRRQCHACR